METGGDLVFEPMKLACREKLRLARAAEGYIDNLCNTAGIALHHGHPVGKEHRLVDTVRHQEGRRAILHPDPLQFDIHAAA